MSTRIPFISLCCVFFCVFQAREGEAQSTREGAGFVRILNLITLPEPSYFSMGEFKLNDGVPIPCGENSGVLAIYSGTHSLEIKNISASPQTFRMTLTLEPGKVLTVVSYDDASDQTTLASGGARRVRCHILSEGTSESHAEARLSLFSFVKSPLISVNLSGHPLTLSPRKEHQAPVPVGKDVRIVVQNQLLERWSAEKAVHYLAFLYRASETEEVRIVLLENRALRPDAPLESEKSSAP